MGSKRYANATINTERVTWCVLTVIAIFGTILFIYNNLTAPLSQSPTHTPSNLSTQHSQRQLLTSTKTGLKFHSIPYTPHEIDSLRWGIIFDAGSTGSRVHIYRFRMTKSSASDASDSNLTPILEDEIFVEVKPGLSAYVPQGVGSDASTRDVGQTSKVHDRAHGPDAAAASLISMLDLCLEQIPSSAHANTPISLRATAGLRLLGEEVSSSILTSIRTLFGRYPFPFLPSDVEVMGGSEEGVFAWITVNYLNQALSDQTPLPTTSLDHHIPSTSAILDLGGASTQIVFEPSKDILKELSTEQYASLYSLPYGANQYNLYETSYLGYGLMEARRKIKMNLLTHPTFELHPPNAPTLSSTGVPIRYHPCLSDTHEETVTDPATGATLLLRGYSQGHASCAGLVRTLFPKHPVAHCPTHPFCSFGGQFALSLAAHAESSSVDPTRGRIYAFSYFYDRTLEIFELEEESSSYATTDGTILRLGRIRELADTICSFSMKTHTMRSLEEIEREKSETLEHEIAQRKARGCQTIHIHSSDGRRRTVDGSHPTKAATSPPIPALTEGECLIEEKPASVITPEMETKHAQISSPFVALLSENPYLCLDLSYAYGLLHTGYDLPETTDLHIMKRIEKKEIGWCLGAMLNQMALRGW